MIKTVEISGFGGSYEQTCQLMLTEGLKFLSDHPNFDWDYRGPRMGEIKIVGLLLSKSDDAKPSTPQCFLTRLSKNATPLK